MNKLFMSNLNRIITLFFIVFALFVFFNLEQASAQTIDANPNPIKLKIGQQQGSTTITWSAPGGGGVPAGGSIYYTINGVNETFFTSGITGTQVVDFIEKGNEYIFTLYNLNKTMVLDSVSVKAIFRIDKSKIKVLGPYYKNKSVDPHGTYVDFKFDTRDSTLPRVMISEKPPLNFEKKSKTDTSDFEKADVAGFAFAQKGTDHSAHIKNLKPNTTYHYVIASYDKKTKNWYKNKGQFKTLERFVTVKFDKIKVFDDSDDLSDGDFKFGFYINKEEVFSKKMSIGSGDTKNIFITRTRKHNDSDSVELRVSGFDNDQYDGLIVDSTDFFPPAEFFLTTKEGSSGNGEWTVAVREFFITPDTADKHSKFASDGEFMQRSFEMYAWPKNSDSEVKFHVKGLLRVFYK